MVPESAKMKTNAVLAIIIVMLMPTVKTMLVDLLVAAKKVS